MSFKITAVPKEKNRGWSVKIDGEEVRVGGITVESKFGKLEYGMRPEGYDGWAFREQGGGGAVTLPFAITPDGDLLVGLLLEQRVNMGEKPVWCAIGGFLDPGETHKEAQARETAEESGLDAVRAEELPGMGVNSNRAFFVADASAGEGIKMYGLEIPFGQLEKDGDDGWKLKDAAFLTGCKKAGDVRFFLWSDAVVYTPDALALSAIAKLMAMMF